MNMQALMRQAQQMQKDITKKKDELNKKTFLTIELGLQSIHNDTLKYINRGHDLECFVGCFKKLKQRIFLLIMLSLSIIMIGLIVLYAGLNYNNSINTTVSMMSRFVDGEPKRNPNKIEDYKLKPEFNIDGLYRVIIQNSVIVHSPENLRNNIIDEYAIKILKRNN